MPLVTVPATGVLQYATYDPQVCERMVELARCPTPRTLATLTPGLLNLVPILWARSAASSVRRAAFTAAALGALRRPLPVAAYLSEGGWARGSIETPLTALVGLFLSLPLWPITLLVFAGFAIRVRRGRAVPAGAP